MEEPPRLNSDTNSSWTILRVKKQPTLEQVFQAGTLRAPRSLQNCASSYVHCSLVLKSAQEGRGRDAVQIVLKGERRGEKGTIPKWKKKPQLRFTCSLCTSETRLPTQTRFTTTTRNLRSDPGQRDRGAFVHPPDSEMEPGRRESAELCKSISQQKRTPGWEGDGKRLLPAPGAGRRLPANF